MSLSVRRHRRRCPYAGTGIDEGGLAGPVRTEQANDPTTLQGDGDIIKSGLGGAVVNRDALEGQPDLRLLHKSLSSIPFRYTRQGPRASA